MGFQISQIFAHNPWVLAYGFSENCQFPQKLTETVFLGRDPHIMDQLYIMVPYMSFYGFLKFSNFCPKSLGVILRL
jgi:hypothetical protein